MEYVELNNGLKMPQLGIGTFMLSPEEAELAVYTALTNGYRSIDTANGYMNEKAVGRAIKKSEVARSEIFLTSKIFPSSYGDAEKAIDDTLKRLDVEYLDLMLLHQPFGKVKIAWQALEKAVKAGKIKAIGVSNFDDKDLGELLAYAEIGPVLNQVECHPYYTQTATREKCAKDGIKIEAWYPLGQNDKALVNEPIFEQLAKKYHKSNIQIILRWHIQMGNIVIPGSKNPEHIKSNGDIFDFELTADEMVEIKKIDKNKRYYNMPKFLGAIMFPLAKMDFNAQP